MMKTEKSRDLISRADAIEAVGKLLVDGQTARVGGKFVPLHFALMNVLSSLPSASVEVGEWIPCSERLPEVHPYKDVTGMAWDESDDVLICMNYGNMHVATYEVDSEARRYWVDKDGLEYTGVIAWMPLPKPYGEDGEA